MIKEIIKFLKTLKASFHIRAIVPPKGLKLKIKVIIKKAWKKITVNQKKKYILMKKSVKLIKKLKKLNVVFKWRLINDNFFIIEFKINFSIEHIKIK